MNTSPHQKMPIQFETIYRVNIFTATVHMISGVVILISTIDDDPVAPALSSGNSTGPYLPAVCFSAIRNGSRPHFHVEPEAAVESEDYITALVVTFFLLSAAFQYAQSWNKDAYSARVKSNDVNILRYIEYSLSASVMMILIACIVGVYDVFTHILIFTCTFLCMMLGLVADFIRVLTASLKTLTSSQTSTEYTRLLPQDESTVLEKCVTDGGFLMWGVHLMGWVAIIVPYAVFIYAYVNTAYRNWHCLENPSDMKVPWFVSFIIVLQGCLFSSFGVVQTVQFYTAGTMGNNAEDVGTYTEMTFILLSLIAKSLLGWIAASQIIFA
jgi:Heliorhodopsin